MAFTYDLSLLSGQVRLYIGDSVEFQGPRPSGINYDDAEIAFFIANGILLTGSVIAALLALAGEWTAFALSERSQNLSYDAKSIADQYRLQAAYLRTNPIEDVSRPGGFIPIERSDAYSESETVC